MGWNFEWQQGMVGIIIIMSRFPSNFLKEYHKSSQVAIVDLVESGSCRQSSVVSGDLSSDVSDF